MNDNVTRLDMETKVALMAAILYDGVANSDEPDAVTYVVDLAVEIEQLAHKRVCEIFRERKLSRSEE